MRNNSVPTIQPNAGYTPIATQAFAQTSYNSRGMPTAIPINTLGNIALRGFQKLTGAPPLTKIVIQSQMGINNPGNVSGT